ncbi:hypothetical protein V6O07_04435, partial [Arthrospira platensis SPKY2]
MDERRHPLAKGAADGGGNGQSGMGGDDKGYVVTANGDDFKGVDGNLLVDQAALSEICAGGTAVYLGHAQML